jgi:hypothetical protein
MKRFRTPKPENRTYTKDLCIRAPPMHAGQGVFFEFLVTTRYYRYPEGADLGRELKSIPLHSPTSYALYEY